MNFIGTVSGGRSVTQVALNYLIRKGMYLSFACRPQYVLLEALPWNVTTIRYIVDMPISSAMPWRS